MSHISTDDQFVQSLTKLPAAERIDAVMDNLEGAIDSADAVGEPFMELFPLKDRSHVSELLGHPFGEKWNGTDQNPIHEVGPYRALAALPEEHRAQHILENAADYEDYIKEVPEYLLFLPMGDRRPVAEHLGIIAPRAADQMEKRAATEAHISSGSAGIHTVQGEDFPLVRWGKNSILLTDLDRFLAHEGTKDYSMAVSRESGGVRVDEIYGTRNSEGRIRVFGRDGKSIRGWDDSIDDVRTIPLSDIRYLAIGPTEDVRGSASWLSPGTDLTHEVLLPDVEHELPDGTRAMGKMPESKKKEEDADEDEDSSVATAKKSPEASKVSWEAIYRDLTPKLRKNLQRAVISYTDSDGIDRKVIAGYFPSGTRDENGELRSFGEKPSDGKTIYLMDQVAGHLFPLDTSKVTSYSVEDSGILMSTDDPKVKEKSPEDLAYLRRYTQTYEELRKEWAGVVMAFVDTETVGVLEKLNADKLSRQTAKDLATKPQPQLLQIAGIKVAETPDGNFEAIGSEYNESSRLSPSNIRVLEHEVEQGVNYTGRSRKDHSNSMHWALTLSHRGEGDFDSPLFTKEEPDALGDTSEAFASYNRRLPKQTIDPYKPGRKKELKHPPSHYLKTSKMANEWKPHELTKMELSAYLEYEAHLAAEEEVLLSFVNWLKGLAYGTQPGSTGPSEQRGDGKPVRIIVGHNIYSFDKEYLNRRLREYELPTLPPDIVYLDTLHLVRIMYKPVIGALAEYRMGLRKKEKDPITGAVSISYADENMDQGTVPVSVRKEAYSLMEKIGKNDKLQDMIGGLGFVKEHGRQAHDAAADVRANLFLLNNIAKKMKEWEGIVEKMEEDRVRRLNARKSNKLTESAGVLHRKRSRFTYK